MIGPTESNLYGLFLMAGISVSFKLLETAVYCQYIICSEKIVFQNSHIANLNGNAVHSSRLFKIPDKGKLSLYYSTILTCRSVFVYSVNLTLPASGISWLEHYCCPEPVWTY